MVVYAATQEGFLADLCEICGGFRYLLYTGTATISGSPYIMINTMIPTEQRGFYSAITQWQSLFVNFIVSALGVMLGQHMLRCATGQPQAVH